MRRGLQRYHVRARAEGVAVHVNEQVDAVGVDCERHLRVAEVMQISPAGISLGLCWIMVGLF